jgi:hypothetical protein
MVAADFSETLVTICETSWCPNPEVYDPTFHHRENIKSQWLIEFIVAVVSPTETRGNAVDWLEGWGYSPYTETARRSIITSTPIPPKQPFIFRRSQVHI